MLIDEMVVRPGWSAGEWPYTIHAVAQLANDGLRLRSPITVLIGANGSGKSTVIEAIAEAYGIDVRGGHGARRYQVEGQDAPATALGRDLVLRQGHWARARSTARSRGYFFRGETATETLIEMGGVPGYGDRPSDQVSHGESYLQVITGRFNAHGLYLLDEAEAPLSFESTLVLLHALLDLAATMDAQVIYATHSPLVAAMPGAEIYELGPDGMVPRRWDELVMVDLWRRLLADPGRFFLL
jgi:predicted ATPase